MIGYRVTVQDRDRDRDRLQGKPWACMGLYGSVGGYGRVEGRG